MNARYKRKIKTKKNTYLTQKGRILNILKNEIIEKVVISINVY
jgi:hypothetical protein